MISALVEPRPKRSAGACRNVRWIAALLALLLAVGCTAEQWHPVTSEESERLAIARFNNFDAGTRPFTSSMTLSGITLTFQGWVDYANHIGYASVTGDPAGAQALVWNESMVAIRTAEPDADGNPALPLETPSEAAGWQIRGIELGASALDSFLLFVKELGLDRPENPLLLQQAGALWLGEEKIEIGGEKVAVTVFAAPESEGALGPDDPQPSPEAATVRLFLDDANLIRRVEALLGAEWVTVDFGTAPGPELKLA